MPERGGPSLEDKNFKAMKQESKEIAEGLVVSEYMPPGKTEIGENEDLELVKGIQKKEEHFLEGETLKSIVESGRADSYHSAEIIYLLESGATNAEIEKSLQKYLDGIVFPHFKLEEGDRVNKIEEIFREGVRPEVLGITDRSFENIKETLNIFYRKLIIEGVIDTRSLEQEIESRRELVIKKRLAELLENPDLGYLKYLLKLDGFTVDVLQDESSKATKEMQSIHDPVAEERVLDESSEVKYRELDKKWEDIVSLERQLTDLVLIDADPGYSQALRESRSVDIDRFTHRMLPDEFTKLISLYVDRAKGNLEIMHNCSLDTLRKAAESGKVVGITSLEGWAYEKAVESKKNTRNFRSQYTKLNKDGNIPYIELRKKVESALGYEGEGVVYGLTEIGKESGHHSYGDYTIVIRPESFSEIYFSEGDSLPSGDGSVGKYSDKKIKDSENHFERITKFALRRQLIYEHALISIAAKEALRVQETQFSDFVLGETGGVHGYIEAHIVGGIPIDSIHIKKIKCEGDEYDLSDLIATQSFK